MTKSDVTNNFLNKENLFIVCTFTLQIMLKISKYGKPLEWIFFIADVE